MAQTADWDAAVSAITIKASRRAAICCAGLLTGDQLRSHKMTWKAPLPKDNPDSGKAHFLFALKDCHGARFELSGTLEFEVLVMTDLRAIADKFTEVVASNLHYQERTANAITQPKTAAEVMESVEGWADRYRQDPYFNMRVKSMVAQLMTALNDS